MASKFFEPITYDAICEEVFVNPYADLDNDGQPYCFPGGFQPTRGLSERATQGSRRPYARVRIIPKKGA
jgi:hypothetical protein